MDNIVGEVNFKFNARFSQLIGRNLISNPIVALAELVKNSYDADADNITVAFENLKAGISTLQIIDDGDGMSFEDIETKWMMVGTDNKIHHPLTAKGRRKLGEKGIGRFSVERLAKKVKIISTRYGEDFSIILSIDWDNYDQYSGEFSEIKHQVLREPRDKEDKGTVLVLEDLRDIWSEKELLDLQKELGLLRPLDINKISYKKYSFPGDAVKINLVALDFLKTKKLIDTKFINYAQAHLYGEINDDGTSIIQVYIKSNISASNDEIRETFHYNLTDIDTTCGPITYEAFIFLKDQRLYRSLDIDRKDMDDYLNAFCGVKIYRDGFRILPFGDVDNDWLELNAQRTSSPEFRVATQNTIGLVYISRDENPGLQDVLSRENMYETLEFESLKSFVNLAFEKYTQLQLGARKKKERKVKEEGQLALSNAKKTMNNFSSQVGELKQAVNKTQTAQTAEQKMEEIAKVEGKVNTIVSAAEASLETLQKAYSYYKKQTDFKSREMQIYRNIATLGISAAMFGHEALNQTVDAKAIIQEIFAEHTALIESTGSLEKQLLELNNDLLLIDEKADFYRNYLQKEKQDRSRYINIYSALKNLLMQHENAFRAIHVEPKIELSHEEGKFLLWGYEGDIDTIFTNLITNAYKALKKVPESKYFIFSLMVTDEEFIISAKNNGNVISKEDRSRIFEPLFSTYSDGTGLGLTIVQDTMLSYQGSIILADDYPDTHFVLKLPRTIEPEEEN